MVLVVQILGASEKLWITVRLVFLARPLTDAEHVSAKLGMGRSVPEAIL